MHNKTSNAILPFAVRMQQWNCGSKKMQNNAVRGQGNRPIEFTDPFIK
jgi:hypothetical protein